MGITWIQSRSDFFEVLAEAGRQVDERLGRHPDFDIWHSIRNQLDAMREWTADGRTPAEDERKSINIGLIAVRELEPAATVEEHDFNRNLHQLSYYFRYWPEDPDKPVEQPW